MKEHVTIEVQKFKLETEELRSRIFDNKIYKVNKGRQKLEIIKKYYAEYLLKQLESMEEFKGEVKPKVSTVAKWIEEFDLIKNIEKMTNG